MGNIHKIAKEAKKLEFFLYFSDVLGGETLQWLKFEHYIYYIAHNEKMMVCLT